jgi:hypothetical protein
LNLFDFGIKPYNSTSSFIHAETKCLHIALSLKNLQEQNLVSVLINSIRSPGDPSAT